MSVAAFGGIPLQELADVRASLGLPEPEDDEGAKTVQEWARELGYSIWTVRDRINKALAKGEWEELRSKRTNSSGHSYPVAVYRPVEG